MRSVVGLSVCMCVFEALRGYLYISTVTCISLDRWHQNGNGNGGVETAVRGRTGIRSVRSDQMEAWLRFERLVRAVFDWVDGGRRGAYLTRLSRPAFGRITYIFDSHSHDARIYTSAVKGKPFSYGTRLLFPRPAQCFVLARSANRLDHVPVSGLTHQCKNCTRLLFFFPTSPTCTRKHLAYHFHLLTLAAP